MLELWAEEERVAAVTGVECPGSPTGRHEMVSNGPHEVKCVHCGHIEQY